MSRFITNQKQKVINVFLGIFFPTMKNDGRDNDKKLISKTVSVNYKIQ